MTSEDIKHQLIILAQRLSGRVVDSSEEAIKLLLTVVVGGAVGSVDEVAAVTGVASPICNMIFFASGEGRPRVGLNACHQQHEE